LGRAVGLTNFQGHVRSAADDGLLHQAEQKPLTNTSSSASGIYRESCEVSLIGNSPRAAVPHNLSTNASNQVSGGTIVQLRLVYGGLPGLRKTHPIDFFDCFEVGKPHRFDGDMRR